MTISIALSPSGNALELSLPPFGNENGNAHRLLVPLTLGGLLVVKRILEARQSTGPALLGTPATPTQYMVKEWLAAHKATKTLKPIDPALEGLEVNL